MTAEQAISWLSLKPKNLPVFVLVGTDPLAVDTIYFWIAQAADKGVNRKKRMQAGEVAYQLETWPEKKLPD